MCHRELEAASGLPEALSSVQGYVDMLLMFRALHSLADATGAQFAALYLQHGFDRHAGEATMALEHDLHALGHDELAPPLERFLPAPLSNFSRSMGAHYVVAGSALGNSVVLRYAEARLGEGIVAATSFLSGAAGAGGESFRHFRAAVDRYGALDRDGPCEGETAADAIDGARSTYIACSAVLGTIRTRAGRSLPAPDPTAH